MVKFSGGIIRPYSSKIGFVHQLLDAGLIFFSLWFSVVCLHGLPFASIYLEAGIFSVMIFFLIANANELYASWRIAPLEATVKETCLSWLLTAVILISLAFITKTSALYSRLAMTAWFFSSVLLLTLLRVVLRRVLIVLRQHGFNTKTVAIAGKTKIGFELKTKIERSRWMGLNFIGFYDDRKADREAEVETPHREPVFNYETLIDRARRGEVDYVYITLPMRAENRIIELVNQLADTTASVYFVPNFFVFDLLHGQVTNLDGMTVLSLHESPFSDVAGWVKRTEDVIISSLILLLIAAPMLLIALSIKCTSKGPVLFKQRRFGLNGKEVQVWKFRTMNTADNGSVVMQATKDDPRITPLGAFLRRTSLDELPQFFNVLGGSMSVVGPRPHAVAHNEHYRKLIKGYMLRHKVKPGITGLAQVNGWRGETDTLDKMEMRVKYDLDYVKHWSLWLDLKIILMTIFKGFINKNAY